MKRFADLRPAVKYAIFWSAKEIERIAKQAMFDLLRDEKYTAALTRLSKRSARSDERTTPLIEAMVKIVTDNPSIANKDLRHALARPGGPLKELTVLRGPTMYEITATKLQFRSTTLDSKISRIRNSREFQIALIEHLLGRKFHPLLRP